MSELAETIERVVREVLAGLGHTVAAGPAAPVPAPAAQTPTPPAARPDNGESLSLDARVVTLADLPERFKTVRRVIVPRGTVVTPAVRDELQRRRIELTFGETNDAATKTAQVIVVVASRKYDPAPLAGALEREGFVVQTRRADCLIRATDELAGELKSGATLGVLTTSHAAAALCLANRHAGVRAILGTRSDAVVGETASVGANLLVVDPGAMGFFALKQVAGGFLRGGARKCPEVFRERLG